MRDEEARAVLAALAIEEVDGEGRVVPLGERRAASAAAGAPLPPRVTKGERERFLSARAGGILKAAAPKAPAAAAWMPLPGSADGRGGRRFAWAAAGLAVAAALAGYLSSELGPDRRINILSYPLLGILAWSLLVYAGELLLPLLRGRPRGRARGGGIAETFAAWFEARPEAASAARGKGRPGGGADAEEEERAALLAEAARRYRTSWCLAAAPLWRARTKALLHGLAFLLALSAVGGLYVKGLANEYRAVWESTFFADGASLRPLLTTVLGPAAAATGREIPDAEALDAMHWRAGEDEVAGAGAAWWIHWYAMTVALFVLLPRALLAALWAGQAARLSRRFEVEGVAPAYFERLFSLSSGGAVPCFALPYATRADETFRSSVEEALRFRFGKEVRCRWADPLPFGEEGEALGIEAGAATATGDSPDEDAKPAAKAEAAAGVEDGAGEAVVVFNFSDTPEEEAHGTALRTLASAAPSPVKSVVLDTRAFLAKDEGAPDAAERFEGRLAAWRRLVPAELELVPVPAPRGS